MDLKQSVFNDEILGYKIKLSADNDDKSQVSPQSVVDMVRSYTEKIREQCPHLERGEVALLAALTLAKEKLALSGEYKNSISELETTAHSALSLIEEVSPTTL